ncbi:rolling circle replication-associated protein [Anaerotignum propionicum]|uniref:rolling circle replication-associated protein n=1 Tax=Anaerotignum propionicum TaxID=28446 RepID=UPI00289C9E5E|nr:hypothetical protein [Anaerotignum propionicum]
MEKKLEKVFKEGALLITLTYKGEPPSEKVANKEIHKFLLRLKHQRREKGLCALKYFVINEIKNTRVHHHLLINPMDVSQAKMTELWGHGRAKIDKSIKKEDFQAMVRYLTKEDVNRQPERWIVSKNIKRYMGGI